ncbi:hypothetical protein OsJ_33916 [Oryza sativa Japonica Group]|uniref:Uncharacterized protein n=1 Tax=Oryza sativa subsp. japonica TaxID=39947 RepID=B9GAQ9_ORYSJ|nr:hypothetical protein OsJ_33916 [Oryza sativa Japonica Group]
MDELDYYRLQQQIEKGEGCSAAAANYPEASYASSSTPFSPYQLLHSARSQITVWASYCRKRKQGEGDTTHCTMLPLEIRLDISKRINGIVNDLQKAGNSVRGILLPGVSHPALTSNQRQSKIRNTRLTTSVPIELKVYGRDADRDRIIEILLNEESSDLRVLPIVGIGGIGKTTLTRFIYSDRRIIDHFDLRIWICVSTYFNEVDITREILEHIFEDKQDKQEFKDVSNFNVLQEILLKNIRDKRFLLVLDDMWKEKDMSGWDKLLAPLKHSQVTGCMVLATTRKNSVAEMIGTVNAFQISGLDEKEFWQFFKACAFGKENYEGDPSLQSIGRQIAKALKGCPLAARSVGALLNRNVSYEHWRTIRDKWKSLQIKDDDFIPILKLSYDYLPSHLQRCFSYCSLFPEDHPFSAATLVQVSAKECYTVRGLQSSTIRQGIRHLSIITTGDDNDKNTNFPTEKYEILQKIRPLQKLRSLMLFGSSSVYLLKSIQTVCKEAKCLRLLRVCVLNADISAIHTFLNPHHLRYLEFIRVSETKDMLVYGDYKDAAFPRALTSFYHLQVLDVGFSGNISVPAAMNNLVKLRHLIADAKVHFSIGGVGNMISLQKLKFKVQNISGFDIRQLQSMNKLVTLVISHLENVKTKDEANGARLIDKEYLKKLFLSWSVGSMSLEPERTKDVLEGLQPHHNLKALCIAGYTGPTSPTWLSRSGEFLDLLKCFQCLGNCKLVKMWNLVELSIPSLEKLILIELPKLEKCFGTYGTELTSRLRVLKIKDCPQLNEFTPFQSFSSFRTEQKSWFPSLNKLTIGCCPHISKWEILPLREMQSLKELELVHLHAVKELLVLPLEKLVLIKMASLEYCSGLTSPSLQISTSLGDRNESLSGLHDLTIHDCPRLVVSHPLPFSAQMRRFSISGIPTLPTMELTYDLKIKSEELVMLDDKIISFHNFARIRSFCLVDCPNLVSLSTEGLNQCTVLEKLHIKNCPNLIIPSSFVVPSLQFISIQACGISGHCLTEMLSHVQSLHSLELHEIPQLKFVSFSHQAAEKEGMSSLEATAARPLARDDKQLLEIPSNIIHSLRWLDISNCPTGRCPKLMPLLVMSDKVDVALLPPSLENLEIDMSPELSAAWDLKLQEHGQIIPLQPHPSLEELDISNLTDKDQSRLLQLFPTITALYIWQSPELTSLQLGYSKALREPKIIDCGSLASIEGFGSLTNLRSLAVSNSPGVPAFLELLSHQQLASAEILSRLETLQVGDGSVLTVPLCRRLASLRRLSFWSWDSRRGETMIDLTEEQERALQLLASLHRLDFWHLPNLRSLPAGLRRLASLEWLDVEDCPGVARLPEMGLPPSLTRLHSADCIQINKILHIVVVCAALASFSTDILLEPMYTVIWPYNKDHYVRINS